MRVKLANSPFSDRIAFEALSLRRSYLVNLSNELEALYMYVYEPKVKAAVVACIKNWVPAIRATNEDYKHLKNFIDDKNADFHIIRKTVDESLKSNTFDEGIKKTRDILMHLAIQQLSPGDHTEYKKLVDFEKTSTLRDSATHQTETETGHSG